MSCSVCLSDDGCVRQENLFVGSYEDCRSFIKWAYSTKQGRTAFKRRKISLERFDLDIMCVETGRLMSFVIK